VAVESGCHTCNLLRGSEGLLCFGNGLCRLFAFCCKGCLCFSNALLGSSRAQLLCFLGEGCFSCLIRAAICWCGYEGHKLFFLKGDLILFRKRSYSETEKRKKENCINIESNPAIYFQQVRMSVQL
jgi:hypothetical protein